MQVGLLGPFRLVVDGEQRPVAGAGERALLALLACAAGRTVSKDRLIDALWGEALPANPVNALHLRVSKLRKLVGEALVAEAPGYRLYVDGQDVDVVRFARLVAERRFAAALELWRGSPLEEFVEQPWARGEAARLEELRATAVEEHIEGQLAAGDHVRLVAELEALTEAYPLRERLRGQLMLALYRSGRTADALAAYHDLRRTLDQELGLEPSASLRRLQEAILRQDAALDGGIAQPRRTGNLPNPLSSFIGRTAEVQRLGDLSAANRLVTLVGAGGAGKTTLAIAYAREAASAYPDGAWLVRLAGVRDGARIPAAVAEALDLADPDTASVRRLVTAWLAPRQALLILDNCEHLADPCAAFVEQLLEAAGNELRIVATSREALGVRGEIQMAVPPLALPDAVALFVERAAAVGADAAADDADIPRICEQLDRMPLAIELAAARAKTLPVADIATRLDDRFGLLTSGPRTAEARHRTLRAAVDWSHDLLSAAEQVLFRRLAVFAGGWTLEAADEVCGSGGEDTLDLLERLVDQSLVVVDGSRFRMLETIRSYAAERLAAHGDLGLLQERHARFFTALAEAAEPALRGPKQRGCLALLRTEESNLALALEWSRTHAGAHPDVGLRLAGALGWYWYVGRQVDGRAQLTATLAASPDTAAAGARARALQALSLSLRPAGCIVHASADAADAARESLALFTRLGEPAPAAFSQLLVAVEAVAGIDVAANLVGVEDARRTLETHGDAWGLALADFVEMEVELFHGTVERALMLGRQAAERFDALDDAWGRSAVRLHLGAGLRMAGLLDDAHTALDEAVALSREAGLPNNLARSFAELGEVALHRDDPDEAERWCAACEQVAGDLGNDALLALVALGRGTAARLREDPVTARQRYHQALEAAERGHAPRSVARAALGLAASAIDDGDHADAAAHVARAIDVGQQIGDVGVVAGGYEQLARLAAAAHDRDECDRFLAEADALRQRHRRPRPAVDERDVQRLTAGHVLTS